ncbi:MAG: hypothetical protein ACLPY5_06175 [Candidatus Bathyarchaeia archaeon]
MKGVRVTVLLLSLALISLAVPALSLFPFVFPTRSPVMIGNEQVTSSVSATSSGSVSIQVFSNSVIYSCGDIVFITAEISGLSSLFGATVQFQVYEPGGRIMLNSASQTNSNGQATYQFTLPDNCLTGAYNVYALYANLGSTVSSNVGFTVQSATITTATSNVTSTSTSTSLSTSTSTSTMLSTSTSTSTTLSTSTSTSTTLLTSTSVLTSSVVATVTTAIAFSTTSTVESSVPVYVLANPLAELAVLIGAIASILSIAFVIKARTGAKSIICPDCGHMNPPHASKFCVNCGKPLRDNSKV